ncbi:MAG: UPF0149 family protein [Corallincola sp.]|nr:UPF0149 family protein [Corallincola sp.]
MHPDPLSGQAGNWLARHNPQCTPAFLHGFYVGLLLSPQPVRPSQWLERLVGPNAAELVPTAVALELFDALYHFDDLSWHSELTLPKGCELPKSDISRAFERSHGLHQWCKGASLALTLWPDAEQIDNRDLAFYHRIQRNLTFFLDLKRARTHTDSNASGEAFETLCHSIVNDIEELMDRGPQEGGEWGSGGTEGASDGDQVEEDARWSATDVPDAAYRPAHLDAQLDGWDEQCDIAQKQSDPRRALTLLDALIQDARTTLGEKFWSAIAGEAWYHPDARPALRAMALRGERLMELGRLDEARKTLTELLRLSPQDNLGMRYLLINLLCRQRDWSPLEELLTQYQEQSAWHSYASVLMGFAVDGDSKETKAALKTALRQNSHVPRYLLGKAPLPAPLPDYYTPGDGSEAQCYAAEAIAAWHAVPGAIDWLTAMVEGR